MDDIRQWLEGLGLGEYADAFEENLIDADVLPTLTSDDLKEIGVQAVGIRRKLLNATAALNASDGMQDVAGTGAVPDQRPTAAERRQLTVMFCDLVGSTALSRQLDPEDLRDVMRRYQDAVAGAVVRYGGYVAKYLGDGVLAYFGWPQAYEDQAERAVRAGLDAVVAVNNVPVGDGNALEARVGISTGQVVVGDLVGESGRDAEAVTGETPNLAARLQGVAEPSQVVVGEATRQLIDLAFTVGDPGTHNLKGFDDGVQAWPITGEVAVESRFDSAHGAQLTEIVGRESELQLLLDRWHLAENGEGQVVLISGEAGIGKSRLMQGLRDQVSDRDHTRVRYQCSPYHTNSALHPTIQQLERAAGFAADDLGETKLGKLETLLREADEALVEDAPLFANLLSLNYEDRYGALTEPPQQIKDRLLAALIRQLVKLAERRPVLFLFEDAHWIDPTSQELLERTIGQLQEARLLLIITHRPEWQSPFHGYNNVTSLQLNRLGKTQGAQIVRAVAGNHVPDEVVERIVQRTDGVPLFVEELTKAMAEAGFDNLDDDVPITLQASLMARLDRLGPAKEVAQIGAVIGREFGRELLARVAEGQGFDLSEVLDQLVESQLVFRTRHDDREVFTFKHALIQDVAYESLLRRRRQTLHLAIADALSVGDGSATEPENLARHFELGNDLHNAVRWLDKASIAAARRSAQPEAAAHCMNALRVLQTIGNWGDDGKLELELLLRLGQAQFGVFGGATPRAMETFARAGALAARRNDTDARVIAQYGQYVGQMLTSQLRQARDSGEQVRAIAQETGLEWVDLIGIRLIGGARALMGDLVAAHELLQRFTAIDERILQEIPSGFAHSPISTTPSMLAHLEWALGNSEAAFTRSTAIIAKVDQTRTDANSLPYALTWDTLLSSYDRNPERMRVSATRLLEFTRTTGGAFWEQIARWGLGTADVLEGNARAGLPLIAGGIDGFMATGGFQHIPYMQLSLVEAHYLNGDMTKAFETLGESQDLIERTEQRFYEPELYRWRGIVLEAMGRKDEAAAAYRTAIAIAERQGSVSWRGRAEENLASLEAGN